MAPKDDFRGSLGANLSLPSIIYKYIIIIANTSRGIKMYPSYILGQHMKCTTSAGHKFSSVCILELLQL